ncbi:MAG TPA: VRR-NUC domain-containing protein [Candidatus Omnitrophota bacterium]|nr:VRR-NUC domain-containing protein [Candidatus Omnitrophota bacterium]
MEKKRMNCASEGQEQTALFEWAEFNKSTMPGLSLMFHIPNGGKRDKITAVHLKAQGVKSGVPDIFLPVPRFKFHGLFIEMKVGNNKPSYNQSSWINDLKYQGYYVMVCYGWVEAAAVITNYLKGGITA